MKYFVLRGIQDDTHVYISDIPETIERQYELVEGVSRIDGWPNDVVFRFSDYEPEGLILTDCVRNSLAWLILSGRFKNLLQEFDVPGLEFLPAKIENHKGRIASENYFTANLCELMQVVDRSTSEFEEDALEETQVFSFDKLVLLEEVEEHGPAILRMKEKPTMILAREDLVSRIQNEGLSGARFVETAKFKTFDPDD